MVESLFPLVWVSKCPLFLLFVLLRLGFHCARSAGFWLFPILSATANTFGLASSGFVCRSFGLLSFVADLVVGLFASALFPVFPSSELCFGALNERPKRGRSFFRVRW